MKESLREWKAARILASFFRAFAWNIAGIAGLLCLVFLGLAIRSLGVPTTSNQGPLGLSLSFTLIAAACATLLVSAFPIMFLLARAEHLLLLIAIEENTRAAALAPPDVARLGRREHRSPADSIAETIADTVVDAM